MAFASGIIEEEGSKRFSPFLNDKASIRVIDKTGDFPDLDHQVLHLQDSDLSQNIAGVLGSKESLLNISQPYYLELIYAGRTYSDFKGNSDMKLFDVILDKYLKLDGRLDYELSGVFPFNSTFLFLRKFKSEEE